jgi:hypothetical protein
MDVMNRIREESVAEVVFGGMDFRVRERESQGGNARETRGERRDMKNGIRTKRQRRKGEKIRMKRSMRYAHHKSPISTEIERIQGKDRRGLNESSLFSPPPLGGIYYSSGTNAFNFVYF